MNNKPLTEADAPYQKVAPKEVAEAIDKALGLKTNMNNEPVAWRYRWKNSKGQFITGWQSCVEKPITDDDRFYFEPLYTHPAKTLTDEEILNVAFCSEVSTVSIENDWDGTVIDFAKAILKKASEK